MKLLRKISGGFPGWSVMIVFLLLENQALWACPFCNVDGPATRAFILTVMGSAILGAVFIFLWSLAAGQYRGVETPKYRILEIDEETSVRLPDRSPEMPFDPDPDEGEEWKT